MKVADLPQRPSPGVVLYCSRCMREFSATRGDYFMHPREHELTCDCDSTPGRVATPRKLELRRKETRYVRIR